MRFAANRPFPLTESPFVGGVHAATLPPSSPPTRNTHEDGFNFAPGGRERLRISKAARVNCSRLFVDSERKTCGAEVVSVQTASFEESIDESEMLPHNLELPIL